MWIKKGYVKGTCSIIFYKSKNIFVLTGISKKRFIFRMVAKVASKSFQCLALDIALDFKLKWLITFGKLRKSNFLIWSAM